MGHREWLSRFLDRAAGSRFIAIELMVGLSGRLLVGNPVFRPLRLGGFRFLLYALGCCWACWWALKSVPDADSRARFEFKELVSNVLDRSTILGRWARR